MSIESLLEEYFQIFHKLNANEKKVIIDASRLVEYDEHQIISHGRHDCLGIFVIINGDIRAYMNHNSGKEITLYHLYDHDTALFTASCMMIDINFDIYMEAESKVKAILIPKNVYQELSKHSTTLSEYNNSLLSSRFSDIMWILEQVVFHTLDKRLAYYLLEQINSTGSNHLVLTHEKIANDLGTAREVISRMLKYFHQEKILSIKRNLIIIEDENKLEEISNK